MIYLDNGATSFPKPPQVADAVYNYIMNVGGNINRGNGSGALSASETVLETRELLNKMMNGYGARNTIFTPGNTYSLNFFIKGLAEKGDTFLTSMTEHNAVYRPLSQLEKEGKISVKYMPCTKEGKLITEEALNMINENIKAVILLHASNVSGSIMPIEEIGKRCREKGVIFIVDAAQTAGNTEIDIQKCCIDGLAFPAHKSMLAPQGLGVMMINPKIKDKIRVLVAGGTGSHSELSEMPNELPDRFESGTLNIPAIFGLNASCKWLAKNMKKASENEKKLSEKLIEGLKNINNVEIAGIPSTEGRVSVISINFTNEDNALAAFKLEKDYGITTRVGLHCAPLAHKSLGTYPGGTVRFSIGPFNTIEDIDTVLAAVKEIAENK